jgi:trans-aconitate methyltransferase
MYFAPCLLVSLSFSEVTMTLLLFPGRHHLLTNFQLEYLTLATGGNAASLPDVNDQPLNLTQPINVILWAVTSANHANTRRNPLPAHRREAAIEDFSTQIDADSFVFPIDDVGLTPKFAEYVCDKIEVDSQGRFRPTPANTVVACSTPEVIAQYERLGFRILPVELLDRKSAAYRAETPWQLMNALFQKGEDWRTCELFLTKVARATRRLYLKYAYGDLITQLYQQPLLTDDGDLTDTRDYNTYARSFDDGADRKYDLIKDYVLPGRIVDIGCCTGSLQRLLTRDERLRASKFYGVEVAMKLFAECLHRKEQGYFASDEVFFYNRNAAAGPIFPPNSVNTFTTFSLTHELESYQGRATLERFLTLLFEQLAPGGRWINVDVIGPENKDDMAYLWLNRADGRNDDYDRAFGKHARAESREYLKGLSTFARFLRFAQDFRHDEGYRLPYTTEALGGETYVRLTLRDAAEFLSKKDYVDNWRSEMHETFCFWDLGEWKRALQRAGFVVHAGSRTFANPWIVKNRYEGKVKLLRRDMTPLDYPATTVLLVAEKPVP